MRMETVNGELRPAAETDEETRQVNALIDTRAGATCKALLAELRPVFDRYGLNADDKDFIRDGLRPLVREKLWHPAVAEIFLGGRF